MLNEVIANLVSHKSFVKEGFAEGAEAALTFFASHMTGGNSILQLVMDVGAIAHAINETKKTSSAPVSS